MAPLSGSPSWRFSASMRRDLSPGLRWTWEALRSRLTPPPCDLAVADLALACSAYGMVFLEPKDPVHFRWLIGEARSGRIGRAFLALDCWMLSFGATILCTLVLALVLWRDPGSVAGEPAASLVLPLLAALGFFTRDIALFVLLRTWSRERGDFAALAALAVLLRRLAADCRACARPAAAANDGVPPSPLSRPGWKRRGCGYGRWRASSGARAEIYRSLTE